jgi:hypothetical protein
LNTTLTGSQLVSWWSQANGRNTFIQVTNTHPVRTEDVHVQILGPDCLELRNFCDTFTPNDTHVYNLGDLFTNAGIPPQDISEANLQGTEGIIVVTPVDSCPGGSAISFNFLQGNLRIIDSRLDVDLGTNVYARLAVTFDSLLDIGDSLDGVNSGFLENFVFGLTPSELTQNFSIVGGGATAGADLVLISFNDFFGPPYSAVPGVAPFTSYSPGFYDAAEQFESCTPFGGCFVRIGLDDVIVISDDFVAATPPPTPCDSDADCTVTGEVCNGEVAGTCSTTTTTTCFLDSECPTGETCTGEVFGTCGAPPTPIPTTTPTPTPDGDGGDGGGGCAIAGPVSLGTAMANVILPLIPVAFAFGLGALRLRNRKEDK